MPAPAQTDPIDRSFLQNIAIFGGLLEPSMEHVVQRLRRRQLPAGELVLNEGDRAGEMFVVEDGEVEVLVHREPSEACHIPGDLVLAVLRRGACFGEMSLLDIQPRSATVRTRSPSSLLVLGYRDLQALQLQDNETFTMLVMNIAREVSRRLRLANRVLVDVLLSVQDGRSLAQEIFGGTR